MATPWLLAGRHLRSHWLRSGLTMLSLTVAMFLFCLLISLVTSMEAAVSSAATDRVIVQSKVSLFVALPKDYQSKIEQVPGVEACTKFQWFGGYYQKPENYMAQFGIDHGVFLDMYRKEMGVLPASAATQPAELAKLEPADDARAAAVAALAGDRRAAIVGEALMATYGWKVGDTVPITGTIFTKADGSAWDFNIVGVYRPLKSNVDPNTIFFRYDYLDEALQAHAAIGPPGVGCYSVNVAAGHDPEAVIAATDAIFSNGPQATLTTTEAAFQAGFLSMMGNLPFFIGTIGGAVVFAVVFSVINTMLMSGRQRLHETGILKALGFTDGAVGRLMIGESLLLSLLGGGAGVLLAAVMDTGIKSVLGTMVPAYHMQPSTALLALGVTAAIGIVAGVTPAIVAARLRPTAALRSEG
ncbi:MAG TPA: ABC transporter permease [Planctomycetota bacterium]|nr:ABC transporter permease [Planctomycetota bacterium]